MRLWIDPVKLNAYKCTVADVRNALNAQNVELPSGKLTGNNTELTVKTVGNLSKPEEFNNIIIRTDGDKIVRLSDVGGAELGPENIETSLMSSGLPMIELATLLVCLRQL